MPAGASRRATMRTTMRPISSISAKYGGANRRCARSMLTGTRNASRRWRSIGPRSRSAAARATSRRFIRESIATDVLIGTGADLVADAMAFAAGKGQDRKYCRLRRDPSSAASAQISQAGDRGAQAGRPSGAVRASDVTLVKVRVPLLSPRSVRPFLAAVRSRRPSARSRSRATRSRNQAIPEILFWKERERTLAELGACKLVEARKFGFLLYPLSGGFSAHSFLPAYGLPALLKAEDWVTRPFSRWLTGMRMLVVLEKTSLNMDRGPTMPVIAARRAVS